MPCLSKLPSSFYYSVVINSTPPTLSPLNLTTLKGGQNPWEGGQTGIKRYAQQFNVLLYFIIKIFTVERIL